MTQFTCIIRTFRSWFVTTCVRTTHHCWALLYHSDVSVLCIYTHIYMYSTYNMYQFWTNTILPRVHSTQFILPVSTYMLHYTMLQYTCYFRVRIHATMRMIDVQELLLNKKFKHSWPLLNYLIFWQCYFYLQQNRLNILFFKHKIPSTKIIGAEKWVLITSTWKKKKKNCPIKN